MLLLRARVRMNPRDEKESDDEEARDHVYTKRVLTQGDPATAMERRLAGKPTLNEKREIRVESVFGAVRPFCRRRQKAAPFLQSTS